jgi:hypothetical protein
MRALVFALVLALVVPGCFGGSSITGPSTNGDTGRTSWRIDDGLCDGGLLGGECDLEQHLALGATPTIAVTARNGTDLSRAHLVGGANVAVENASSSTDDHGVVTMTATVRGIAAGVGDIVVADIFGHEIDRAHVTFVTAIALTCGLLGSTVTRDLTFHALSSEPVTMVSGGTTTLACRATDAAGNPLLTVDAITWTVVPGGTADVSVRNDELFSWLGPVNGGTARVDASGSGTATVRATLGAISGDVVLNVR